MQKKKQTGIIRIRSLLIYSEGTIVRGCVRMLFFLIILSESPGRSLMNNIDFPAE